MNLYSVYDRVSGSYLPPQAHSNDGVASRAFVMSCANPEIHESYLKDISLVRVGTFDEIEGSVMPVTKFTIMFGDSAAVLDLRRQYMEVIKNETSEG